MIPDRTVNVDVRRKKGRHLHPWIFSNEIKKIEGSPEPGSTIRAFEAGAFVGSGIYNPHSLIAIRLYSKIDENLDIEFFKKRIAQAYHYRKEKLPDETDYRLVFGESDLLPGLVIDRYGGHFALQAYAAGMDMRTELVCRALKEVLPVESIFEKNDFNLRTLEGLERKEGPLFGETPDRVEIHEHGVGYWADIKQGQKTGFYFDQRPTRSRIRALARGRRILDLFSYTGGFAINGALGGAAEVLGYDISDKAVEIARFNSVYNNVDKTVKFEQGDVFEVLRGMKSQYDLIALDPPSFTRSKKQKKDALRGYKELNLRAMGLLAPGGILVTCTCSRHVSDGDFEECLVSAAEDRGRDFRIIERIGAGPDHPVVLGMPETEYLKCYILEVC